MARRRDFVRGAAAIRKSRMTSWLDVPITSTVVNTSGVAAILSLTAAEKARRPFTVIRTRLHYHMRSDQLSADEFQACAIGMCVVSDQASAIGVTAVPTPSTDAASDLWFLHQWVMADYAFITGVGFDAASGASGDIDSKAQRKVNDDEDVLVVLEVPAVSLGVEFVVGGRLLIKEH